MEGLRRFRAALNQHRDVNAVCLIRFIAVYVPRLKMAGRVGFIPHFAAVNGIGVLGQKISRSDLIDKTASFSCISIIA
ncbi:hypothetical protein [Bacillus sonorensis]|uniref:hypothetical protein n=1 Tax=Bacillus sonorensis TaxID=119858 RepID=UPI001B0E5CEE|nr:hypothetical protein [Bacillus sonorensis]MCY8270488.1 hypothetical protein [Bacillus sonorensis]MCY8603138.1 hypothetical protein [Bacillus sonorensis]GIN68865.1 hypothetical protein J41TS2_42860 [Bacillus sonorensis]